MIAISHSLNIKINKLRASVSSCQPDLSDGCRQSQLVNTMFTDYSQIHSTLCSLD